MPQAERRARAQPPARGRELVPVVVALRVGDPTRRTPIVFADVRLDRLVVTFTAVMLRRGWDVRPPLDTDGEPLVTLPDGAEAAIADTVTAAINEAPEVRAALIGWRARRYRGRTC
jgi:hypothetical protein